MNQLLVMASAWLVGLVVSWLLVGRSLGRPWPGTKRRALSIGLLVLGSSLVAGTAGAQDPRRISLDEAIALFAEFNPDLREARYRAAELAALARQAGVYPNPTFNLSHEPGSRIGEPESETYFTLSQRFESPGKRRARRDAADRIAKAAGEGLSADSLRLVFDVKQAWAEAVAAEREVEVLDQVTQLFRRADIDTREMRDQGEVSGYALRRLRVERARYEGRLAIRRLDVDESRRRLSLMILREGAEAPVAPAIDDGPAPRLPALEDALETARANRAEIREARAEMEAAGAELALARRERTPDPTVTGGYVRQTGGYSGIFLGLSAALPVFDRNRGAIDARQALVHAAETKLIAVERQVDADVRRAFAAHESLDRRRALISDALLGDAEAMLSSARSAYAEGEMSLVELLDAAEAYLGARLSTIELDSDLRIVSYDLLRAMGGTLIR